MCGLYPGRYYDEKGFQSDGLNGFWPLVPARIGRGSWMHLPPCPVQSLSTTANNIRASAVDSELMTYLRPVTWGAGHTSDRPGVSLIFMDGGYIFTLRLTVPPVTELNRVFVAQSAPPSESHSHRAYETLNQAPKHTAASLQL